MVIKKFNRNQHGRDFIIGDLHGQLDKLHEEMYKVAFCKETDRIFAVGDLIDRGPDSLECLNLLFEPWFHSVRGNHEEMMFESVLERIPPSYRCWMVNGGLWALDHMNNPDFIELLETISEILPLAIEVETVQGTIGILHADPPEFWNVALIRDLRMKTLWGRNRISKGIETIVKDIDAVYVGHTPLDEHKVLGNVHYIDTGACFPEGKLTMVEV